MMMMRHSLTVHLWSSAFKHPLRPFWSQVTANIWLSLHTMAPGFPSFLLMHLQPIHIQKAEGWEEWDLWRHCGSSGVNLCEMSAGSLSPPHLWTLCTFPGDFGLPGLADQSCWVFPFLPLPLFPHLCLPTKVLRLTSLKEVQAEARGWGWKFTPTNNPIVFPK